MAKKISWPADTRVILTSMLDKRERWKAIAVRFGCSVPAVRQKAIQLNLWEPKKLFSYPTDFFERVSALRAQKVPWGKIADQFGVNKAQLRQRFYKDKSYVAGKIKRFTEQEDAILRAAYLAHEDLNVTAQRLNRSHRVLYQRLFHKHHDLIDTDKRDGYTIRAINRYGIENIAKFSDGDLVEAVAKFRQARKEILAAKRAFAIAAKEARNNAIIDALFAEFQNGAKSRNEVIFEMRAAGIVLDRIGQCFNLTEERIRQICDIEAVRLAYETKQRQVLQDSAMQVEPLPTKNFENGR